MISFQKIYGLYGLEHHTVEINGDVTMRTDDEQVNIVLLTYSVNGQCETEFCNSFHTIIKWLIDKCPIYIFLIAANGDNPNEIDWQKFWTSGYKSLSDTIANLSAMFHFLLKAAH